MTGWVGFGDDVGDKIVDCVLICLYMELGKFAVQVTRPHMYMARKKVDRHEPVTRRGDMPVSYKDNVAKDDVTWACTMDGDADGGGDLPLFARRKMKMTTGGEMPPPFDNENDQIMGWLV
jgi:hypothetical protein